MKLVQFGADVTVRDLQKETPLHLGLDPGLTTRKCFMFFFPFSTTKNACSLKTDKKNQTLFRVSRSGTGCSSYDSSYIILDAKCVFSLREASVIVIITMILFIYHITSMCRVLFWKVLWIYDYFLYIYFSAGACLSTVSSKSWGWPYPPGMIFNFKLIVLQGISEKCTGAFKIGCHAISKYLSIQKLPQKRSHQSIYLSNSHKKYSYYV